MRIIKVDTIADAVSTLVKNAALTLRPDVTRALKRAVKNEKKKYAKGVLNVLLENASIASRKRIPICQDTGMTVVYCEIGRDVHIKGNIDKAINNGVTRGTREAYLRRSVVRDPIERNNTQTNTPVIIHYAWRAGGKVKISVLLKGFGCENKGQIVMLNPTASREDIQREIVRILKEAGPNACPPYIVGVGIGGTLDKAAEIAKHALLKPIGQRSRTSWCARLEKNVIQKANALNIGPLGLGGNTTVLDATVKTFPTHIAGLPLAVNINCHALRSRSVIL